MPRIVLDRLVFTHDGHRPFPNPLDVALEGPGWIGLVGPNGAGKTTLLRLIAGELMPERGELRLEPRSLMFRRVAQTHADALAVDELEQLARAESGLARRLRGQLALDPRQLERWATLSPGERQRWQLARALSDEPELLLCDEPSNHLDAASREYIVQALRGHRGLGLLVSHDRALLDSMTTHTLFVDEGRIDLRIGAHAAAQAEREREREHERERYAIARAELQRAERQVDAARRRLASAERSRNSSSRKADHSDHDASSSARKFRADRAATSQSQVMRRRVGAQERRQEELEQFELRDPLGGNLFVDWEAPRKRVLVHLGEQELGRVAPGPWTRLPGAAALQIERDAKIWLRGRNGAGKTSLLRALHRRALELLPAERVLWLGQELDARERGELIAALHRLPKDQRGRVLQILAAAGVDPEHVLRSPDPSPGEARKLALALGLARQAWLLLLDEPTNHLDLPAIAAIERMLTAYPGALVLVSHDEQLGEQATTARWEL